MPGTSVGMVENWPLWQADHCLTGHAELPREGVAAASPLRHGGHRPAGRFFPGPRWTRQPWSLLGFKGRGRRLPFVEGGSRLESAVLESWKAGSRQRWQNVEVRA